MNSSGRDEEYLAELMRDFPCAENHSVNDALEIIQERYRFVWSIFHDLDVSPSRFEIPEAAGTSASEDFVEELEQNICIIHSTIFHGILANSGQYRKVEDAENGDVYFGGSDPFYRMPGRFKGSKPEDISAHVRNAIEAIVENLDDPLRGVCVFYQRFVKTHPFYDANGRIGRLIGSYILSKHGLEIRWGEMESKNNKFLWRLNAVHKHERYPNQYINYLVNYVRKFTHEVNVDTEFE